MATIEFCLAHRTLHSGTCSSCERVPSPRNFPDLNTKINSPSPPYSPSSPNYGPESPDFTCLFRDCLPGGCDGLCQSAQKRAEGAREFMAWLLEMERCEKRM